CAARIVTALAAAVRAATQHPEAARATTETACGPLFSGLSCPSMATLPRRAAHRAAYVFIRRRGPRRAPRRNPCRIVPSVQSRSEPRVATEVSATEWWRGAVIYQVYPRSFKDTDGDGVGDLPGIVERLDYIASLGVDAIWISPFFRSPMADFGYDIADYRDVDPLCGTLEGFDRLLSKAHGLGIRVVIDQVLSHTSDQHAGFRESRMDRDNPKADWYVWADPREDGTPPNNWMSLFGGVAWRWEPRREQYYLHNFLAAQPDLNFHNPDVQAATLDNVAFWL